MKCLLNYPNTNDIEELVWDEETDRLFIRTVSDEGQENLSHISFFDAQSEILRFSGSQFTWQSANTVEAGLMPNTGDNAKVKIEGYSSRDLDIGEGIKAGDRCPWIVADTFQVAVEGNESSPFIFKDTKFNDVLKFATQVSMSELGYELEKV